jgi:hypothetical protein
MGKLFFLAYPYNKQFLTNNQNNITKLYGLHPDIVQAERIGNTRNDLFSETASFEQSFKMTFLLKHP